MRIIDFELLCLWRLQILLNLLFLERIFVFYLVTIIICVYHRDLAELIQSRDGFLGFLLEIQGDGCSCRLRRVKWLSLSITQPHIILATDNETILSLALISVTTTTWDETLSPLIRVYSFWARLS